MTRESLEKWRFLVPGVLSVLGGLSVLAPYTDVSEKYLGIKFDELALPALIAIVAAAIYYLFRPQRLLAHDLWDQVNANIATRLLACLQTTPAERDHLTADHRLMDIFYAIVDNDESLKSRMQAVYFNGLIVTSLVDLGTLSLLFAGVHFLAGAARHQPMHLWWVFGLEVGSMLVWSILVPRALTVHVERSNAQLNFIGTHQSDKVKELCAKALQQMPLSTDSTEGD